MKRAATLLLVLAAGACSRTPAPDSGEMRVIPLSGQVSLLDGGDSSLLEEATNVEAGVSLSTGLDGRAEVQFPGGSSLELAPGAKMLLDDTRPEVSQGSVLVRTGSADVSLLAGAAAIEATGAVFRVDRQTSVVLSVYSGEAAVPGAGVVVPRLRQATVLQNGSTPEGPEPLEVDPNDAWDIRFLGEAIDIGFQLLNLERGLTRQLPRGEEEAAVSAALDGDFPRTAIRNAIRDLGDAARAVVAAVVAREIERIDGGSRAEILSDVVNLQALVDDWIVIVAEWGLDEAAEQLIDQLGELAVAIADSVAPPPAPPQDSASSPGPAGEGGPTETPEGPGGEDPGPGPGDPPDDPPGGGGEDGPPAPPPEEPPDDDPPPQSCGDEVECAVEDIIGDTPRKDVQI